LHNARVTHDWINNLITIEGNGMVQTIIINKHLDNNTKHLKVLLCYALMEGVTNDEEKIFLTTKLDLFMLRTITLSKPDIFNVAFLVQKSIQRTLCSAFHIMKEKFWLIPLLHVSKSKSWKLHNGFT
jgi:hypothetical protein